jgi:hypothetical protein
MSVERSTALAPKGGVQIGRREYGVRHAFCPPTDAGGAVLLFSHGVCGLLIYAFGLEQAYDPRESRLEDGARRECPSGGRE